MNNTAAPAEITDIGEVKNEVNYLKNKVGSSEQEMNPEIATELCQTENFSKCKSEDKGKCKVNETNKDQDENFSLTKSVSPADNKDIAFSNKTENSDQEKVSIKPAEEVTISNKEGENKGEMEQRKEKILPVQKCRLERACLSKQKTDKVNII